jgi:hypothetical protein
MTAIVASRVILLALASPNQQPCHTPQMQAITSSTDSTKLKELMMSLLMF